MGVVKGWCGEAQRYVPYPMNFFFLIAISSRRQLQTLIFFRHLNCHCFKKLDKTIIVFFFFFFFIVSVFSREICVSFGKMKRKSSDEAEAVVDAKAANSATRGAAAANDNDDFSFTDLDLDPRLVQAVAELKYHKPTLVQRKAIPVALKGQDVLCKAKTGSGKTAAYVLPVLQAILKRKNVCLFPVLSPVFVFSLSLLLNFAPFVSIKSVIVEDANR